MKKEHGGPGNTGNMNQQGGLAGRKKWEMTAGPGSKRAGNGTTTTVSSGMDYAAPVDKGNGSTNDTPNDSDDILDARALHVNWLTGEPYSPKYKEHAARWSDLPMYKDKTKLRELTHSISEHQVTIVISGTGSGKTVIVPKIALKHSEEARSEALLESIIHGESTTKATSHATKKVVITNPKSLIAGRNAEFAAETLDVDIGTQVGYVHRGSPPYAKGKDTRLLFTTDGYLVAHNRNDPLFSEYSVIIIDEAHERTIYIDTLLFMLRKAVKARPHDLRVVIISATIDPSLFTEYFKRERIDTALLNVSGVSNKPVISVFMPPTDKKESDYIKDTGMKALSDALSSTSPGNNILFFVPTSRDAEKGCKEVWEACSKGRLPNDCRTMTCSALYAKLSTEKQADARSEALVVPFDRKIIFATNIAESSITLNSLKTVIDSGMELESTWLPDIHGQRMQRVMSTQAQMKQRKGRVGRTQPGVCYHLYSEEEMKRQPFYPDPSIVTVDITDDLLTMIKTDRGVSRALENFSEFITPPTSRQIVSALSLLSFLRAIVLFTEEESDKPLHFWDARFSRVAEIATDINHVSRVFPHGGRISILGEVALDVMRRCKMGLWSALPLVAGLLFCYVDTEEHVSSTSSTLSSDFLDVITLACLLEETGGDHSLLWQDERKGDALMRDMSRGSKLHATSEHLSFLTLYRELSGERKSHYAKKVPISDSIINKISWREKETRASLMAMIRTPSMRNLLLRAKSICPLATSIDTHFGKSKTIRDNVILKSVTFSRMYHASLPREISGKNGVEFATLYTLRPLSVRMGGKAELLRGQKAPFFGQNKGSGAVNDDNAWKHWLMLHENCTISGSVGAKLKTVTYIPLKAVSVLKL